MHLARSGSRPCSTALDATVRQPTNPANRSHRDWTPSSIAKSQTVATGEHPLVHRSGSCQPRQRLSCRQSGSDPVEVPCRSSHFPSSLFRQRTRHPVMVASPLATDREAEADSRTAEQTLNCSCLGRRRASRTSGLCRDADRRRVRLASIVPQRRLPVPRRHQGTPKSGRCMPRRGPRFRIARLLV